MRDIHMSNLLVFAWIISTVSLNYFKIFSEITNAKAIGLNVRMVHILSVLKILLSSTKSTFGF